MAIIEFINASKSTYKGMKRAIDYIKNPKKTELHLIVGKYCSPNTAFDEFIMTKQDSKKEKGRQLNRPQKVRPKI